MNQRVKRKLNKKQWALIISAALIIIGGTLTVILLNYNSDDENGTTTLNNIIIESDNDFHFKYNFPGEGTLESPYIIENYSINITDGFGISIKDTTKHFIIINCTLLDCHTGISIESIAPYTATIKNTTFIGNSIGVSISHSNHANLTLSTFQNNIRGIQLISSHYTKISKNMGCEDLSNPLFASDSDYGHFFNNTFFPRVHSNIMGSNNWTIENNIDATFSLYGGSNHQYINNEVNHNGSLIIFSNGFYMNNNSFSGDFNRIIFYGLIENYICNNTILNGGFDFDYTVGSYLGILVFEGNFVNNKPAIVFRNQNNVTINNSTYGQIFCFNCTSVDISAGGYTNVISPISCFRCKNVTITDNQLSSIIGLYATYGVYTFDCDEIYMQNNTVTNCAYGLYFNFAGNVTVKENTFSYNDIGIFVNIFTEIIIQNNNCTYNNQGIQVFDLSYSGLCSIINNNCSFNNYNGIFVSNVEHVIIKTNIFSNNVVGAILRINYGNISKNTLDNNLELGIYLLGTENSFLYENSITGNYQGIICYLSEYNSVFHNDIINSSSYGLRFVGTANYNEVYMNNFINNSALLTSQSQAYDDGLSNIFYDFDNSKGNYWSDWIGIGSYFTDGSAQTRDMHPQSSPIIF